MLRSNSASLILATTMLLAGCGEDTKNTTDPPAPPVETTTDDVVEIAIRRLNDGQDVKAFESARDTFVELLRKQKGVGTDREFVAVYDFAAQAPPMPPVFIGMTQYEGIDAFQAVGTVLGNTPEAGAFFSTFKPELFTVLRPLDEGSEVNLAGIANVQGQILEVAYRDTSKYTNFDAAAYGQARDAFLQVLTAQPGVVAEYQWVSALDPKIVVGMTVYADQNAFGKIAMDPAVAGSSEAMAFLGTYPPAAGFVNAVVR